MDFSDESNPICQHKRKKPTRVNNNLFVNTNFKNIYI